VLVGSFGPDRIKGGPGNDTIFTGPDADLIKGGAGNDNLQGFFGMGVGEVQVGFPPAVDTVNGGAGLDTCGRAGEDSIINCEQLQTATDEQGGPERNAPSRPFAAP
jgi:Ca2+-binding RTX toxin-like protein